MIPSNQNSFFSDLFDVLMKTSLYFNFFYFIIPYEFSILSMYQLSKKQLGKVLFLIFEFCSKIVNTYIIQYYIITFVYGDDLNKYFNSNLCSDYLMKF